MAWGSDGVLLYGAGGWEGGLDLMEFVALMDCARSLGWMGNLRS